MSWDNPPQRREPAPEVGRHHSTKDKRRWCKGRVGVLHVEDGLVQKYNRACYWGRTWSDPIVVVWRCAHYVTCTTCGKQLRPLDRRQCPVMPEGDPPSLELLGRRA